MREGLRLRNVFIAKLSEAMVSTDKEIESANMMLLIVWRTVGRYGTGVVIPLCLARRAKRTLMLSALRQAVLKREARRAWSGSDGVLCSGGRNLERRTGRVP